MPEQKSIAVSKTSEQTSLSQSSSVVPKKVIITEIVGLEDSGSNSSNAKEFDRLGRSLAASKLSFDLLKRAAQEKDYEIKESTMIAPFKPGVGLVAGAAQYPDSTVFFQEKPAEAKEIGGLTQANQVALRSQTLQREVETVVEMVVLTPRKQAAVEQPVEQQDENPWIQFDTPIDFRKAA